MKGIFAVVLALVALFHPAVSPADTVYVDYDGLGDYTRIQDGIDAVSDGGTVLVMAAFGGPATFRGAGNCNLDFGGKNITLSVLAGQQISIDCEGADRAILLSAGTDSTCHIMGFTFLNGLAADGGGAIRCDGESPRISDCVFRGNASSDGGAIMLSAGPTHLTNCEFCENSASNHGGAVYAADSDITVHGCTFSDNDAVRGGGLALVGSNLTMVNCTLANNGGVFGSGVWFEESTATIEQCVLAFGRSGQCVWGGTPETFHCCVFSNEDGDDLPGNAHDNLFLDPLVCDLYGAGGGNVSLCSNSPCLSSSTDNPWGLHIGSKAQGCADCDSPVEASSWGAIKALFR
jgi:predicted outer membrane repeat protein